MNKDYLDCLICKDYAENCKPIEGRRCSLFAVHDGWWKCDKCGGVWPKPHFEDAGLKAEFDAVTTCSTCISLDMAKQHIAELEAAQQWHPASEPPEDLRHILILTKYNGWVKGNYRDVYAPSVRWWYSSCNVPINIEHVLGWRDLPPMPEVKK